MIKTKLNGKSESLEIMQNKGSEFSSLNSAGKLFQRVGALTANALSPFVFSLDRGIANRISQATGWYVRRNKKLSQVAKCHTMRGLKSQD